MQTKMNTTIIIILVVVPFVLPLVAFGIMKYGTFGYMKGKTLANRLKNEFNPVRKDKE